eukprot:771815-Rhodomonas_salina.2
MRGHCTLVMPRCNGHLGFAKDSRRRGKETNPSVETVGADVISVAVSETVDSCLRGRVQSRTSTRATRHAAPTSLPSLPPALCTQARSASSSIPQRPGPTNHFVSILLARQIVWHLEERSKGPVVVVPASPDPDKRLCTSKPNETHHPSSLRCSEIVVLCRFTSSGQWQVEDNEKSAASLGAGLGF